MAFFDDIVVRFEKLVIRRRIRERCTIGFPGFLDRDLDGSIFRIQVVCHTSSISPWKSSHQSRQGIEVTKKASFIP